MGGTIVVSLQSSTASADAHVFKATQKMEYGTMRKYMMIAAAAGALALVGSLTACGDDLKAQTPPAATQQADKPAETKAAETPKATPKAPAAEAGSFKSPFAKGSGLGNDSVQITLGDLVQFVDYKKANQFNEDPKNGAYFNLPVTVKNVKEDKVTPWIDVRIKLVAPDGRSWDSTIVTQDGDLSDVSDLYPGGTGTGVITFDMPADAAVGGLMASVAYKFGAETFVTVL